MVERVILWGFMASGKTSVGAGLARRLGWDHVDLDAAIEARDGRAIVDIFRESGEPFFRRLEAEATREVIGRGRLVVTPGGGWVTGPGILELIPPRSLTVWLTVSPAEVLRRVGAQRGGAVRPLLDAPDPEAEARRLLSLREPLYSRADLAVPTDGRSIAEIVDELEERVRERAPNS